MPQNVNLSGTKDLKTLIPTGDIQKPTAETPSPKAGSTDAFETTGSNGIKAIPPTAPSGPDELMIATYNVENIFNTVDDPDRNDEEFTPDGKRHWTEAKLAKKLESIAKVIKAMNGGQGPDVLALEEMEDPALTRRLVDKYLKDLGYQSVVHIQGPDPRGIGCAIISRLPLVEGKEPVLHEVHGTDPAIWDKPTRGVLEANFQVGGQEMTVFANHWPSRRGGKVRELQRIEVGKQLREIITAKQAENPNTAIVAMGDFNANPGDPEMGRRGLGGSAYPREVLEDRLPLYDTVADLADQVRRHRPQSKKTLPTNLQGVDRLLPAYGNTLGTHFHHRSHHWNTFDQILVSKGFLGKDAPFEYLPGSHQVMRESYLLQEDGSPKSFSAPWGPDRDKELTRGGFSDHLPVVIRVRKRNPA